MELFKKRKSKFFWYDFVVRGQRYRGSTKETNKTRAAAIAALKLAQAVEGRDPLPRKAPVLVHFSRRFLDWVANAKLERKTKLYYRDGWRLLAATPIITMRLDQITSDDVECLSFNRSPSTTNCALRTLRRMLRKAEEWKLIRYALKLKLAKEYGRSLRLDEEAEQKLIEGAAACHWRSSCLELFRDIVALVRDTGLRNERELYRLRIEHLDFRSRTIFVPDSKTEGGRRRVPMSQRAFEVLQRRCNGRSEGWVFASKRSRSGHLTTMSDRFREARAKAGLPEGLVLYCGRHDFGTRVLRQTGNLAAVMKTMGHRDVKTAMQYQHPELEIVRAALDSTDVSQPRA